MRLTVQVAVELIAKRGPMTALELAEHFQVTEKKMANSIAEWRKRKLIKRDFSDPPKYSFKPLEQIGRDEMGRLSEPKKNDPTPDEIRAMCLEIQREWSRQEEYTRRVYKGSEFSIPETTHFNDSHGGMDFS